MFIKLTTTKVRPENKNIYKSREEKADNLI